MEPADDMTEAEWEDSTVILAKRAASAWLYFVGCVQRARRAGVGAEAAGVVGAQRLLPDIVTKLNPTDALFIQMTAQITTSGLLSPEEANRLLNWDGATL
jgi:hypothetical protein